jgi:hypothetical protein
MGVSLASCRSSSSSLIAWPTTAAATWDFFGASNPKIRLTYLDPQERSIEC